MRVSRLSFTLVALLFLLASARAQTDADRSSWANSLLEGAKESTVAQKNRILKFDFAPLWVRPQDNVSVLGYIGDNYQRLRVVLLSANKQPGHPDTYNVTGRSMVKNVVRSFAGTMKITRVGVTPVSGLDEEYQSEQVREAGVVIGEYHFAEDAKETNTGSFDGLFATYWYSDRNGRLKYDEVLAGADGYSNNQFAGKWTSYRTKTIRPASWGDSRIPLSGGLDIGAGEFSPDEKFVANGWQSYRNAYTRQDKRAMAEERRPWWK